MCRKTQLEERHREAEDLAQTVGAEPLIISQGIDSSPGANIVQLAVGPLYPILVYFTVISNSIFYHRIIIITQ